jgi:pimeloyl-ACP methyl ester carboxylesterase
MAVGAAGANSSVVSPRSSVVGARDREVQRQAPRRGPRHHAGMAGLQCGRVTLETIRVPTLAISARDDGFGTYAGAEYTASRVPGAKFIGYGSGGHLLVGHDEAVRDAIAGWLRAASPR